MGEYLSAPVTTKDSSDGETPRLTYASSGMQGWRKGMEDAHICGEDLGNDVTLFGVFDGHGGSVVAIFARKHLPRVIKDSAAFKAGDYRQALINAFLEIDKLLLSEAGKADLEKIHAEDTNKVTPILESSNARELANCTGCTACVVLITRTEIYVANAGDSRCVLSKAGVATNMSEDHKPELGREKKRIERAEGYVEDNRVNGVINLSRSLGDMDYKMNKKLPADEQMIIALPDVKVEKLTSECDFLIIGCDGVWDCMTSQGAVDFIKEQIAKSAFKGAKSWKLSKGIEAMFDKNIAPDVETSGGIGCDNMTCVVVRFNTQH